jgi:hypothetical protein
MRERGLVGSTLTRWVPNEYAEGYIVFMKGSWNPAFSTGSFWTGWCDAAKDMSAAAHLATDAIDKDLRSLDLWTTLYDVGCDVRVAGIPYSAGWTIPWRNGWRDTDYAFSSIKQVDNL